MEAVVYLKVAQVGRGEAEDEICERGKLWHLGGWQTEQGEQG